MESKKAEYYKEAISIITSNTDWKRICITLAMTDPKSLCMANSVGTPLENFEEKTMSIYRSDGKVAAIKYVRKVKRTPLVESKRMVEEMIERASAIHH